jgi:hypothetical protein
MGTSEGRQRLVLVVAVAAATAFAALLGLTAGIPEKLPGIALESPSVYRVEVGFLCLAAFYVAILLIALAAYGKGIVKFGKDGAEAGEVITRKVDAQGSAGEEVIKALRQQERITGSNTEAIEAVRQAFNYKEEADRRRFKEIEQELRELSG